MDFTIPGGLIALLVGLVIYTSSFIAEIVRAGIQSVGRGQTEAGRALGLPWTGVLRNVTFPQALRVIVPPLISQFLNLTKNSSLAGAIGYSDLTNVAKTMTQTAPAVVHIHAHHGGVPGDEPDLLADRKPVQPAVTGLKCRPTLVRNSG